VHHFATFLKELCAAKHKLKGNEKASVGKKRVCYSPEEASP